MHEIAGAAGHGVVGVFGVGRRRRGKLESRGRGDDEDVDEGHGEARTGRELRSMKGDSDACERTVE